MKKYRILSNNVYNFDETEFQMSIIETVRVITESERIWNSKLVQSENQE